MRAGRDSRRRRIGCDGEVTVLVRMLQRGNYGVEWSDRGRDDDPSFLVRLIIVVVLITVIAFAVAIVKRTRAHREIEEREASFERGAKSMDAVQPTVEQEEKKVDVPPPPPPSPSVTRLDRRPPKVRNLLMRLEAAEKTRDIEMAITTIEQLRTLPGAPAADLDDKLARRLGELNALRLFELKSPQWVREVTVKSGDTASRIAAEYGSTFASLKRLNDGPMDKVKIGQTLFVLNHPRFNLVVHRRSKTADLQLNGKFFKRYDLRTTEGLKDGAFEWREVSLSADERKELDVLLPRTTSVLISEM